MELLLQAPQSPQRNETMDLLRQRIGDVFWSPRRVWTTPPPRAPGIDFLAQAPDDRLWAFRWIEPNQWESVCRELIETTIALQQVAEHWIETDRGATDDTPANRIGWVFVVPDPPARWRATASLLNFPLLFLKTHLMTSADGGRDAIYFESCVKTQRLERPAPSSNSVPPEKTESEQAELPVSAECGASPVSFDRERFEDWSIGFTEEETAAFGRLDQTLTTFHSVG